jgi:mersacidin/lichenicidin family type 2 lantibiotic
MPPIDVIRAWKDEEYLNSLSETERGLLPRNPAGIVELSDDDLVTAAGGQVPTTVFTISALGSCYSCVTCPVTTCITITIPITNPTVSIT